MKTRSKKKIQSTFEQIADLNHQLNRIRGIDRESFFGRLEILEYFCEQEHRAAGEGWRKFGRYGNIVHPDAMTKALHLMVTEAKFTRKEFTELSDWLKGQANSYGHPDQAVGYVMINLFLEKEFDKKK